MRNMKGEINMLKLGLMFLFGTFSHAIITIISYQFYFRYAQTTGGVGGNIVSNIHPLIWVMIASEFVISTFLIIAGLKENAEKNNE